MQPANKPEAIKAANFPEHPWQHIAHKNSLLNNDSKGMSGRPAKNSSEALSVIRKLFPHAFMSESQ